MSLLPEALTHHKIHLTMEGHEVSFAIMQSLHHNWLMETLESLLLWPLTSQYCWPVTNKSLFIYFCSYFENIYQQLIVEKQHDNNVVVSNTTDPLDHWGGNPGWYVVLIIQLSQGHTDPVVQGGATQTPQPRTGFGCFSVVETWGLRYTELWVTILKKVKTIEPLKNIAWWWYERTCRYDFHKLCAHTASRCSLRSMRHNHDKHTLRKLGKFCLPIFMVTHNFSIYNTKQGNPI